MASKRIGAAVIAIGMLAVGGYYGVKTVKGNVIRKEIDEAIAELPASVDVTYRKVDAPFWGNAADIYDIEVDDSSLDYNYTIERMSLRDVDVDNEVPRHLHVTLENIEIDQNEWDEGLQVLGFGELFGTLEFQYRADEQARTLESFTRYQVDGVGQIETSFSINDIELPTSWDAPAASSLFESARLRHADVSYRDDSLIPRIYEAFAAENDISVDETKQLAASSLDRLSALMGLSDPATTEAIAQVKQFAQDPKRLYISVEPTPPLDLQELAYTQPQGWPRLLNLKVRANQSI
ncbi:MAG: hypothetical protein AAFX40_07725 [Cyanobacteria bacterium J06639_1]